MVKQSSITPLKEHKHSPETGPHLKEIEFRAVIFRKLNVMEEDTDR